MPSTASNAHSTSTTGWIEQARFQKYRADVEEASCRLAGWIRARCVRDTKGHKTKRNAARLLERRCGMALAALAEVRVH